MDWLHVAHDSDYWRALVINELPDTFLAAVRLVTCQGLCSMQLIGYAKMLTYQNLLRIMKACVLTRSQKIWTSGKRLMI